MEHNPYTPPSTVSPVLESEAVKIRKNHIKHEGAIRSAGFIYWLAALPFLFIGICLLIPSFRGYSNQEATIGVFIILIALVLYWLGRSVWKLKSWARVPMTIFSGIGLLGFPLGTLINAYILYLIFSKKGAMVFSDAYQEIIRETPEISYQTSKFVWLIIVVIGGGFAVALVSLVG